MYCQLKCGKKIVHYLNIFFYDDYFNTIIVFIYLYIFFSILYLQLYFVIVIFLFYLAYYSIEL